MFPSRTGLMHLSMLRGRPILLIARTITDRTGL